MGGCQAGDIGGRSDFMGAGECMGVDSEKQEGVVLCLQAPVVTGYGKPGREVPAWPLTQGAGG